MGRGAVSLQQSSAQMTPVTGDVLEALKARLTDRLERLSAELLAIQEHSWPAGSNTPATAESDSTRRAIQERIRLLGQLASGLADVDLEALPIDGVGFGSTVTVEDLDGGRREEYTLVTGQLIDPDAGQVSLASPVGQALLGRGIGDTVEIRTPQKLRRVRIDALRTIHDRLGTNGRQRRPAP
jgi:transcription elongation factor GreA